MKRWMLVLFTVLLAAPGRPTLDLHVPVPPTPVRIRGTQHLVYELHITNITSETLALTRLEVKTEGRTLADVRDEELRAIVDKGELGPGDHAVAYLWLPLDGRPVHALHHRLEYGEHGSVEGGATSVSDTAPVTLGAPLRGGPWVAIYDPSMARGHRRVFVTVDGQARIPGRFAVDFMKLDARARFSHDDSSQVANWNGYGADVLAVANGVIAETRDGIPESATISFTRHALTEASGNYISLGLSGGRYALYEHLKPGSLRVKKGDHVRAGQVIAALGYTGDSTGPHLHLHVAGASSDLAAEGLPFVLASFQQLGRYESMEALGKEEPWKALARPERRKRELPAANAVIELP